MEEKRKTTISDCGLSNANLVYYSIFGPVVARQVLDHMAAGRGAPTDHDMERFRDEADAVALHMLESIAKGE